MASFAFPENAKARRTIRKENSIASSAPLVTSDAASLPEAADSTKVTAEFRDGVLKVHLPTTTKAKSKALEVKVA